MSVFASKMEKTVLLFVSPDSEQAADHFSTNELASVLDRVTKILTTAARTEFSLDLQTDHELITWASATSGNFSWLASFAQFLHLRHYVELGSFHKSYDNLNSITHNLDHIPIGSYFKIPNLAFSEKLGVDFRRLANPYTAYQLLGNVIARASFN